MIAAGGKNFGTRFLCHFVNFGPRVSDGNWISFIRDVASYDQ
jgi:hypothetical protein